MFLVAYSGFLALGGHPQPCPNLAYHATSDLVAVPARSVPTLQGHGRGVTSASTREICVCACACMCVCVQNIY